MVCGRRFSGGRDFTKEDIWEMYLHGKQTIAQISETTGLSASTVTRRLASISFSWEQPRIKGSGVIHLDATYFGRNTGVLLALESGSGRLLYMKHIAHEHISDYEDAGMPFRGLSLMVFKSCLPSFRNTEYRCASSTWWR